jgi:hypothetical protein
MTSCQLRLGCPGVTPGERAAFIGLAVCACSADTIRIQISNLLHLHQALQCTCLNGPLAPPVFGAGPVKSRAGGSHALSACRPGRRPSCLQS